jgi:hypothetical protein
MNFLFPVSGFLERNQYKVQTNHLASPDSQYDKASCEVSFRSISQELLFVLATTAYSDLTVSSYATTCAHLIQFLQFAELHAGQRLC